jgi:cardiolipin synthase A/B
LQSGLSYFSKLEALIAAAHSSIHFQVYIFNNDTTGKRIIDALITAANRGVQIYLVVDAYASKDFDSHLLSQLRSQGIWVKTFAPLHLNQFKIGRRLHHKIVLVDERIALVGGINIANHYSGFNGHTPWLDVAVCAEGPIAYDLKKICLSIWPKRIQKKWKKFSFPIHTPAGHTNLKVLQNDWWRRRIELSSAYNAAIRNAQTELVIVASYFLPGFTKRRLLKKAADRGVKITLVTGHDSDIPFMNAAVKYLYGVFLKNNIAIYEWTPSVLHAKMALVDGKWCTIGSYNINALSDYGSLEANIEIADPIFAQTAQQFIQTILEDGCLQVEPNAFFKSSTPIKQVYRWASYKLMRVLLFILFVLMNRDKLKRP